MSVKLQPRHIYNPDPKKTSYQPLKDFSLVHYYHSIAQVWTQNTVTVKIAQWPPIKQVPNASTLRVQCYGVTG